MRLIVGRRTSEQATRFQVKRSSGNWATAAVPSKRVTMRTDLARLRCYSRRLLAVHTAQSELQFRVWSATRETKAVSNIVVNVRSLSEVTRRKTLRAGRTPIRRVSFDRDLTFHFLICASRKAKTSCSQIRTPRKGKLCPSTGVLPIDG